MIEKVYFSLKNGVLISEKLHPNPKDVTLWKNSHYVAMSDIIAKDMTETTIISSLEKQNLGTTISPTTLKKIFKYDSYNIGEILEQRQIKTLSKLAVFIGYKDWYSFYIAQTQKDSAHQAPDIDMVHQVIAKAMQAEFDAYLNLPNTNIDILNPSFVDGESAYRRILSVLDRQNKRKWVINNDLNPSAQELLDLSIKSYTTNEIQVETEEYWYLRWYDTLKKKYTYIYNQKNKQLYVLARTANDWKVKVNYYDDKAGKIINQDNNKTSN